MMTIILNDLIKQYNIKDQDIFLMIVKKALLGEIKPEDVGYNFHLALNLELGPAVELAVKIQYLDDKDKAAILKELDQVIKPKIDLETEIRNLLIQNQLDISDDLNTRLMKLVSSFVQGIRDEFELKDAFLRSGKVGGIGLNENEAESLMKQLKIKKSDWLKAGLDFGTGNKNAEIKESEIDVGSKAVAPKAVFQPMESDDITIDQILAQRARSTGKPSQMPVQQAPVGKAAEMPFVDDIKEEAAFLDSKEELEAPEILPAPPAPVAPLPTRQPNPTPPPIRPAQHRQPLIRQTEQGSSRPQMSDVKFEPKLYGPLDELAAMSLADFRRLSKDPGQAGQKIRTKLEILEGESVSRKNDGIKALKSSPLYNIYADIMNRALVAGKSFEAVIQDRGDINIAEFKAIMDLNKSLKY